MNKKELVARVKKSGNFTQAQAKLAVDAVFDEVGKALENGETVKIVGFGTFGVKQRAARNGVSPKDKTKKIYIEAKTVPTMRYGKSLKNRVNH